MLLHTEAFTYFAGQLGNRNFTSVFGDRTSCRAKGLRPDALNWQFYLSFWRSNLISCERIARDNLEIAILLQFLAIKPHFVRSVVPGHLELAILPQLLAIEPHFVRKGCAGQLGNRNFTSVFGDRTSFRATGLRFVPSRWHCPAPSREKKKRRGEQEGKRARGQERM